jgi:drug/metabolite transporter (DMT)-like permease
MIALLLRLYPAAWRRRYGDEFAAVLEERPLGPFDVADVLLGALDAHLHRRGLWTESGPRKAPAMTLRIGGLAAIVFGLVWAIGLVWATASEPRDQKLPGFLLMALGQVCLVLAVTGLSAFQARRHGRLIWAAVILPAVGCVLAIGGGIGMLRSNDGPLWFGDSAWDVWALGLLAMLIGSILFAIATLRTRALETRAVGLVLLGAIGVFISAIISPIPLLLGLGVMSLGWIWLGVDAIRRDRVVAAVAS